MNGMNGTVIALVVLAILVLLFVARSVRMVPQSAVDIIERLGRYHRQLTSGMNLVVPGLDQTRARIDLREQLLSLKSVPVPTTDRAEPLVGITVYYQVVDPLRATYEIENFQAGLEQLTRTTLRSAVGSMDLATALTGRGQIGSLVEDVLRDACGNWGIQLNRVVVDQVEPPGRAASATG